MSAPNHYEVLGLSPDARQDEIDKRYNELSRLYQLNGASSGEGMGAVIAEAYRVISNPALRSIYDQSFSSAPPQSIAPSPIAPPSAVVVHPAMERTQEVPPPTPSLAQEKTVSYPAPTVNREEEDKRLAAELTRRGISPDEVRRLVALGGKKDMPPSGKKAAPVVAPPVPPPMQYVPKPTISMPPFRESSVQERTEADRLLTSANIARRRNSFKEAEKLCRQAVELVPTDAAALELYGDVLQATGRVDDAILAYKTATEIDSNRQSAEKKYGDLVLRQDRSIAFMQDEFVPGNANVAVLLSAVFPGAGQVYNGQLFKGIIIVAAFLAVMFIILYTPYGIPHEKQSLPMSLGVSILIAGSIYIYSVVDANITARRGKRRGTGWEV
jgi:curved DNA-binding protein CbpA